MVPRRSWKMGRRDPCSWLIGHLHQLKAKEERKPTIRKSNWYLSESIAHFDNCPDRLLWRTPLFCKVRPTSVFCVLVLSIKNGCLSSLPPAVPLVTLLGSSCEAATGGPCLILVLRCETSARPETLSGETNKNQQQKKTILALTKWQFCFPLKKKEVRNKLPSNFWSRKTQSLPQNIRVQAFVGNLQSH